MPSVKTPDGRTLKFPEGTPPEQVMAVLQEQYPEAFQAPAQAPAAAPAPPPAALPAPPSPAPAPAGMVAATPTPAPPPGPPARVPIDTNAEYQRLMKENLDEMNPLERWLAGAGQAFDSTGRGVRQVWNYATGDKEELARLQADEAEDRRLAEPLLATPAGRIGQISGHLAQAVVPVGAGAKAGTMGAKLALNAGLGAAQSALAPTVEGESRARNAMTGGAIGAVLPVAGRAAGVVNNTKATAIRALTRAVSDAGAKREVVREAAGKRMARLVADVKVPVDKVAKEANAVVRDYGTALPKHVRGYVAQLQGAVGKNAKLTGAKLQEARSALIREAESLDGAAKSGVERLRRVIDTNVDQAIDSMPKTLRDRLVGSRTARLREARKTYKTGENPEKAKPYVRASQRAVIEALRRPKPEEQEN